MISKITRTIGMGILSTNHMNGMFLSFPHSVMMNPGYPTKKELKRNTQGTQKEYKINYDNEACRK